MADHRFRWIIRTLTPLHIGNGERLREGFDFVEHDGALWVANQGALFRAMLEEALHIRTGDEAKIAAEIAGMTIYQFIDNKWLRDEHFDLSKGLFYYWLEGSTSKKGRDGELYSHIKDVEQCPYLPGSSLKGALRSAILRIVAAKEPQKPVYLRGNPKNAANQMEQRHFSKRGSDWRKFPYFDIWRALRIADSSPLEKGSLKLARAIVYRRAFGDSQGKQRNSSVDKSESIPLDLEVIPAGVTLEASSWVDTWLFENQTAKGELAFGAKREYITDRLCEMVNEDTRLSLIEETNLFISLVKSDLETKNTQLVLDKLADAFTNLSASEMLLAVGKGTGWRRKTLGRVLQDKMTDDEFEQMVKGFKLGRGKWKRNEQIPYTRLLATAGDQRHAPLGWLKVRMEPM